MSNAVTQKQGDGVVTDARAVALDKIYRLLRAVVACLVVAGTIWLLGGVLTVVFAASLMAVILHGLASLLSRGTGLPHWAALALVTLAVLGALVGLGFVAGPGLVHQATALREALTKEGQSLQQRLSGSEWGRLVLEQVPASLGGGKEGFTPPNGFAGSVFGILGAVFGTFGTLAVVAIAAVYLAAAPATYLNGVLRLVAVKHRPAAKRYAEAAGKALWAWSAGQAIDMLVVGVLSGLGLWTIGVPLALVLGVVAGLLNFVPYIGAIAGAVPAVFIAFSVSSTAGLETIVLYLVIQGFEGNVMAPFIQKRAVHMPPALTILSQTLFGALLGIPGLIFATPLTAALLAVANEATPPLAPADEV